MTPAELFRHYLLAGEPLLLELPTLADAEYMLQLLRTCKYRSSKQLADLGMQDADPLAGTALHYEVLARSELSLQARFFAAPRIRSSSKLQYTILPPKELTDAKSTQ